MHIVSHSHTTVCQYMVSTWYTSSRWYILTTSTAVSVGEWPLASFSHSHSPSYSPSHPLSLPPSLPPSLQPRRKQLDHKCKEREGELYCLRCYDNMVSSICGACRYVHCYYLPTIEVSILFSSNNSSLSVLYCPHPPPSLLPSLPLSLSHQTSHWRSYNPCSL